MKISLRAANALQLQITQIINKIVFGTNVDISEFESPETVISQCRLELTEKLARRDSLVDALYDVRMKVSDANHDAGINNILAKIAQSDKKIQTLDLLAGQRAHIDMAIINGKLDKIKNRAAGADQYGYSDTVNTSALSSEDLDLFKSTSATIKKQKQALQNQLLELNVRTEIELDAATVKILETEQLL